MATALVVLIGCSSGGQPQQDVQSVSDLTGLGDADAKQLFQDGEAAIEECMKRHGFEYTQLQFDDLQAQGLGATTLADAQENGFGLVDSALQAPLSSFVRGGPDGAQLGSDQEAEEYQRTLNGRLDAEGNSEPGCVQETFALILTPEFSLHLEVLDSIEIEIQQRVSSDERILDGIAQWQTCLRNEGFDSGDPRLEVAALRQRVDRALVSSQFADQPDLDLSVGSQLSEESAAVFEDLRADEVNLAVADFACSSDHRSAIAELRTAVEADVASAYAERVG